MHSFSFDGRVLTHNLLSGVENYAKIIFIQLSKISSIRLMKPYVSGKLYTHLWEHLILPFQAKRSSLLFAPANIAPIWLPKITKLVLTLHDVAYKTFPKSVSKPFYWYYSFVIPINIKRADAIITISEVSKQEIIKHYSFAKNKITVIHNGIDSKFQVIPSVKKKKQILYVGSMNERKNLFGVIQAFEKLPVELDYNLVLVGNFYNNFILNSETKKALETAEKNPKIIFKTRLSDQALIQEYNDAALFLFPSFYEGFGFPPLEAMACGTPVITSNISSMPEVCGDAVLYVDPHNIDDITSKIELLLSDEALQHSMIEKGLLHVKQFTWEKAAKEHLKVFESVLNQ